MIALQPSGIPVPDAVATLIGLQMPVDVINAEIHAVNHANSARYHRGDEARVDREACLGKLAAANKILGAYDPRLLVGREGVIA